VDVDWSEMETSQPRLAIFGRRRLLEPGVLLVATIRGDGAPRVSPVEPFVLDGILWPFHAVAVEEGHRPEA
jgi:hypothetical protein